MKHEHGSDKSQPGNAEAVALLEEIARLMGLKGENPFKVRAFEKAAAQLAETREDLAARAAAGTLTELSGIGKGIADVLTDFFRNGKSTVRDEIAASFPPGFLELTTLPGLGPKKANTLIEELGIHSIGELEYACRENRLAKLKGFGEKQQAKILEGIAFRNANSGRQRLDDALPQAERASAALVTAAGNALVSETGALRRHLETLTELEYLVEAPRDAKRAQALRKALESAAEQARSGAGGSLPVRVHLAERARYGYELARLTATEAHWRAIGAPKPFDAATEEEFYAKLDLPLIPPEARETGEEVEIFRKWKGKSRLLPWNGVRGVFHNHTVRSDGIATLEEMVAAAERLGYEYIGISDHSQSAFYAQGLKPADLKEQEKEIRKVQEKFPGVRIFWGIESDILADGSLDYEPAVLKRFDFVVASVHSRFQMDRTTMTERILEAIRNPCTRFLGHATGRLLLSRQGYEVDMERIIAEAAKRDVAIEINANPARLDIDWRWGPELRKRGTHVSINPDAHWTTGLEDTRFGIGVARKALLPVEQVVNSRPVKEVEAWLRRA